MKKIILTITFIISIILCIDNAYAATYYDKVLVKTSFSEDIDLNKIEKIEVHLEDATEYSKDYLLEKTNNFELEINDVPVGPYKFLYGVVIGDEIGYYSVQANVNINNENNVVDVLILVEIPENKTSSTTSNIKLTDEDIDKIVGTKPKSYDEDNGGIIVEDDNDDKKSEDGGNRQETTTIRADIEEAREKEKKEEQKKKERKRNSLIGKIMFSAIGIVILVLVIYAGIKISNANK